jgi:hypothetical protein
MKLRRCLLALVLAATFVGAAYVAQVTKPAGEAMTAAAQQFLASLTPEQKKKAQFAFDDQERFNWHFVPLEKAGKPTRSGLGLEEMTEAQKQAAKRLLQASTSAEGYKTAITVMSLEALLHELEKGKGPTRNPEWYFVCIFGTPDVKGKWGWRIEGHHLSLNFTVEEGKITSATPSFFGANPATVKAGPHQGLRTLPEAEDRAVELFKSLSADQRKIAQQPKQFPEIQARTKAPKLGAPVGLPAAQMNEDQKGVLVKLLQAYTERMPPAVGQAELQRVMDAGLDKVHFAYAGGIEPGQPRTYRVQGPTFVIEFLNVQNDSAGNPANHIHSVWRSLDNDFGQAGR